MRALAVFAKASILPASGCSLSVFHAPRDFEACEMLNLDFFLKNLFFLEHKLANPRGISRGRPRRPFCKSTEKSHFEGCELADALAQSAWASPHSLQLLVGQPTHHQVSTSQPTTCCVLCGPAHVTLRNVWASPQPNACCVGQPISSK
jgi:hypothetical protein